MSRRYIVDTDVRAFVERFFTSDIPVLADLAKAWDNVDGVANEDELTEIGETTVRTSRIRLEDVIRMVEGRLE